ncbi:MAG: NUDIX domain-containing protein [Candidatus Moranbacteria bacterium]|nr:NUDIX domain-containing protein [Candidatus Moranbacteria bacterium]
MKSKLSGTSIIFVNNENKILLFLRDDIPTIRYPNCWDILGGHVEENETPEECIIREMKEEINYDLVHPRLYKVSDMGDRIEHTFWEKVNWNIAEITLNEGQKLKWFMEEEIKNTPEEKIAFNFKPLILEFFKEKIYGHSG